MTAAQKPKSKSSHGGFRPGGGRPKGSKSKVTEAQKARISELARGYASLALKTLAEICAKSQSDAARVAAANSLLDRGYGRPAQTLEMTDIPETVIRFEMPDTDLAKMMAFMLTKSTRSDSQPTMQ